MKKYRFYELDNDAQQNAADNMISDHDCVYFSEFNDIIEDFCDSIRCEYPTILNDEECYNADNYDNTLGILTNYFNFDSCIFDTTEIIKVICEGVKPAELCSELINEYADVELKQTALFKFNENDDTNIKNIEFVTGDDIYGALYNILFAKTNILQVVYDAWKTANYRLDELMNEHFSVDTAEQWADNLGIFYDENGNEVEE